MIAPFINDSTLTIKSEKNIDRHVGLIDVIHIQIVFSGIAEILVHLHHG